MKTKIDKNWLGRVKSIEELHNDSKLWLSEINFVEDEIRFLNNLLASKYLDLIVTNHKKNVELLTKELLERKKLKNILSKTIQNHEKILSNLINTKSVTSNAHFLDQHNGIEKLITHYFKKYKALKKNIFSIIEGAIRKKGQKKLV